MGGSGLHSGVEESVNVNNVFQESPLGLVLGVAFDGCLHFLLGFNLDGFGLSGLGDESDNGDGEELFEHFSFNKINNLIII